MKESKSEPVGQAVRNMDTSPTKNVVDTARAAENLTTFNAALKAAGLFDVLSAKGPFTVFAPTDTAFAKLPSGAWDSLLKDTTRLKAVLSYHVIAGHLLAKDLKSGEVTTLQGSTLAAVVSPADVHVNGARITHADLVATNGIVHSIDAVILPKGWQLQAIAA
jgi:uncharacterized surface protein with fasciclin (FAS1) repeats